MADADIPISLACWDYDRVQAIFDGRVAVEGCRLDCHALPTSELFPLAVGAARFDVTEMSMSSYILQVARGEGSYVAIPVFLSRAFRHGGFLVRADAGIETPRDLEGRLVGVAEYQMTAGLWMRGILADEYGVDTDKIRYRTGALEAGVRKDRLPLALPDHIDIARIPEGATLESELLAGNLDAVFAAKPIKSLIDGDPRVRRLFPDYATAEADYFRRTGFFPIMHVVGVRRSLAEAYPWLPARLFQAFDRARALAVERLEAVWRGSANRLTLPWLGHEIERTRAVMGEDVWTYGVERNRAELDAMCRYSVEQHLAPRRVDPAELFHPGLP